MNCIIALSGGLDSTTLLAYTKTISNLRICTVSFDYGQKHRRELEDAERIANYYKVPFDIINLANTGVFDGSNSTLLQGVGEVPKMSYADQIQKDRPNGVVSTYVPFRNGLMASIASSVVLSRYPDEQAYVGLGVHRDDAAGDAYPDCSIDFCNALDKALYTGSGKLVKLWAPFKNNSKAYIVRLGLSIGVPYELTRSCYVGEDRPCGVCGTCIDRLAAFKANEAKDPLNYPNGVNV